MSKGGLKMKREVKVCLSCKKRVTPVVQAENTTRCLNGITYTFKKKTLHCPHCDEEFYDGEFFLSNISAQQEAYSQQKRQLEEQE